MLLNPPKAHRHRAIQTSAALIGASIFALLALPLLAADVQTRHGEIQFAPGRDEDRMVPEPFRLPPATFSFDEHPQSKWEGGVVVSLVTFPSPVKTPYAENNTVHCEYFRPATPGKHPACVVLHILGGDFPLARVFAYNLAQQGVAALFVKMPYYGERRPPGVNIRMVSTNPNQTVEGMTQAVKDIRYAAAWLAAQDEVDPQQLGIFGISLGGITATLAAEVEPRFSRCCPVLAGGDLSKVLEDSQERHIVDARRRWTADGHSLPELVDLMKTIDPCSYGPLLRSRKVLMLNAQNDEVIPRVCTEDLWESIGRPPIYWYDAGHFSALLYINDALAKVTAFIARGELPNSSADHPQPPAD